MSSSTDFERSNDPVVAVAAHSPSSGSTGHVTTLEASGGNLNASNINNTTFEHPLTAATTAMLNINGSADDSPGFNVFYDIYGKMTPDANLIKNERNNITADIWSPVNVPGGKLSNGSDVTEVFVSAGGGHSPLNSSKLATSVLRRGDGGKLKLTQNGHRYSNGDSLSPNGGDNVIIVKEEIAHSPGGTASPRMNGILGVSTSQPPQASVSPSEEHNPYQGQLFATLNSSHYADYVSGPGGGVVVSSPQQFAGSTLRSAGNITLQGASGIYVASPSNEASYYRDYFQSEYPTGVPSATRIISGYDGPTTVDGNNGANNAQSFVDRYSRPTTVIGPYKNPVTIDVNSPDSGIGGDSITPRDHTIQQGFDYSDICQPGLISDISGASSNAGSATGRTTPGGTVQKSTRPWHEFGRTSEADKIQIPKLFSSYGFRYYLESPISTSQRREDDRITYINKGQFYGITLDYVPDPEKPLKSQTVKSVVMLVFREEKSPEDEIKAWQFWHSRQHSVKQRILDADTKNSVGLVGCIDEVAHNAIAVYWNPLESSAKINVAVQCLSTDFSSQKGVKGLPLHLQIDTYDDPRDPNCPIYHRGYSQIKVFCDKGAERKTRDEERRAAKRKLTATGRKKLDELYHTPCDRTEFYAMSDIAKPPVLFSPAEDLDKLTPLAEFHGYYGGGGGNSEGSEHSGAASNSTEIHQQQSLSNHHHPPHALVGGGGGGTGGGGGSPHSSIGSSGSGSNTPHPSHHHHQQHPPPAILKFHNTFPPDSPPHSSSNSNYNPHPHPPSTIIRSISSGSISLHPHHHHQHRHPSSPPPPPSSQSTRPLTPPSSVKDSKGLSNGLGNVKDGLETTNGGDDSVFGSPAIKRLRLLPPPSERLMIYVRQEPEEVFTPIHLVPPTTLALLASLEEKFKISMGSVKSLYRRNSKGILAKIDDDMLKHYCHEDTFSLEVKPSENEDAFDVTLAELSVEMHMNNN